MILILVKKWVNKKDYFFQGLAKYAKVHFVDAAVFVSEKQEEDSLREESEDIQPDVIVTHGQVEHVEVNREVVPRVFPK